MEDRGKRYSEGGGGGREKHEIHKRERERETQMRCNSRILNEARKSY